MLSRCILLCRLYFAVYEYLIRFNNDLPFFCRCDEYKRNGHTKMLSFRTLKPLLHLDVLTVDWAMVTMVVLQAASTVKFPNNIFGIGILNFLTDTTYQKLMFIHKKRSSEELLFCFKSNAIYFFFALGFGISVMLPSKISAARPIDSFNVG